MSDDQPRRRRQSSVGKMNLGDTSVPALQTMHSNKDMRSTAKLHKQQLNKNTDSSDDLAILDKIWISVKILSYRHTWLPFLVLLLIVQSAYWFSNNFTPSNPLHMFVTMSHQVPGTNPPLYEKGLKDFAFVGYMMIFFTFYREFLMQIVLRPIARYFGLKKESKIRRFTEQTYSICYYGVSGPFGLYVMKQTPMWYFNTAAFYENYPHLANEFWFKFYYLSQAAFWAQQSVVLMLQLEKPRKDFKELVFHHIVTMLLIFLSYRFNFTWMGIAVYITMDISDFFLSLSKSLNYLDSPYIGPFFFMFVGTWIYLRHWLNIRILWSVLTEFRTVGPYTLNFATQQYKCWISQPIVFVLIFALQLVNLYWLFLILRIAYRYVFLNVAEDERSESESESEDDKKND
ncbi:hypothetical protein OGAPHI_000794 [Ogataea philodendri]|uniref:TLC domain-containing protein n=1 Tax=Ogataea philodendri TaxID=1378263 RepID=A0A9P8PF10_9ASCO|nr:uncharacterized protein OGAPHI_000794 [Ogataea philodendri]KAH3671083.1 hypothetical protein OGAPHI_000794 [Ogataea philodendri]